MKNPMNSIKMSMDVSITFITSIFFTQQNYK